MGKKSPKEVPVFLPILKFPVIKIIQSFQCRAELVKKSERLLRSTTKLSRHVKIRCGSRLLCGVLEVHFWSLSSVPEHTHKHNVSLCFNILACNVLMFYSVNV